MMMMGQKNHSHIEPAGNTQFQFRYIEGKQSHLVVLRVVGGQQGEIEEKDRVSVVLPHITIWWRCHRVKLDCCCCFSSRPEASEASEELVPHCRHPLPYPADGDQHLPAVRR